MRFFLVEAAMLGSCLLLLHISTMLVMRTSPIPTSEDSKKHTNPDGSVSKRHTVKIAVFAGVGVSLMMTLVLLASLHPEWFSWLEATARWLESLGELPVAVMAASLPLMVPTLLLKFTLRLSWAKVGLILGVIAAAIAWWALYQSWLTVDLLAVISVILAMHWFQPRVTFMTAWIASVIIAVLYDLVQVFGTGNMEKAAIRSLGALHPANGNVDGWVQPLMLVIPNGVSLDAPGATFLGLGDIVGSGILLVIVARASKRSGNWRLYQAALAGFAVGMLLCLVVRSYFLAGQPATIYLFPFIGFAVIWAARKAELTKELHIRAYKPALAEDSG